MKTDMESFHQCHDLTLRTKVADLVLRLQELADRNQGDITIFQARLTTIEARIHDLETAKVENEVP